MKNRELIYETEHLKVEYCADGKYLFDTWAGYTSKDTYLKYVDLIINFLIERNINNIIVDVSHHQPLGPDAQVIAKKKMINFANEYGDTKIAFILPSFISSTDCGSDEIHQESVTTAFFRSFEDAENWVTKKLNSFHQKAL